MRSNLTTRRKLHIPPNLRGAARAICDVDPAQFPELYERADRVPCQQGGSRGAPPVAELQQLTTEVNDGVPLSVHDFRLFRVAYAECRQHLRGVPAGLLGAGTPLGEVLALTIRMDALCTELGVDLTETFPQLKATHEFALTLAEYDGGCGRGSRSGAPRSSREGGSGSGSPVALASPLSPSSPPARVADASGNSGTGSRATTLPRFGGGEQYLVQSHMLVFLAKILERAIGALEDYREAKGEDPQRGPLPQRVGDGARKDDSGTNAPILSATTSTTTTSTATSSNGATANAKDSNHPGRGTRRRLAGGAHLTLVPGQQQQSILTVASSSLPRSRHAAGDGGAAVGAKKRVSVTSPKLPQSSAFPSLHGSAEAEEGREGDDDESNGSGESDGDQHSTTTTTPIPAHDEDDARHVGDLKGLAVGAASSLLSPLATDVAAAATATSSTSGCEAMRHYTTLGFSGMPCHHLRSSNDNDSENRDSNVGTVTNRVSDAISGVNADLRAHLAHFRWLFTITHGADFAFFNAEDHLDDPSMRKMWSSYIGSSRPACTTEVFTASGLLAHFPAWLHAPMMAVLNFKGCGVVSLYTMQKLLKVWGPLLLLDRNMYDDVRSGVLCLRETAAYLEESLAARADAQVGDFAVALTETPGEVRLVVLRPTHLDRPGRLDQSRARGTTVGRNDSLWDGLSSLMNSHLSTFPTAARGEFDSGVAYLRSTRRRSHRMSTASHYGAQNLLQGHYLQPNGEYKVSLGNTASYIFPGHSPDGSRPGHPNNASTSFSVSAAGGSGGSQQQQVPAPVPLRAVSYRLTQATGAWTVQGLTKEEFESIAEACRAFPDVFRRARGEAWQDKDEGTSETGKDSAAAVAATFPQHDPRHRVSDSFSRLRQQQRQQQGGSGNSGLHRACFRNNARYVRTLLVRGAGTVVNSAVVDPAVSQNFCWTPLLCAVNNPNSDPSEIVELLLSAGANAEYHDDADCTALYYAIANGYAASAKLLLAHKPDLSTSPETVPLMVALGANPYLPCERDVRRLTDVVPSAAMVEVVSARVNDYQLCSLAVRILLAKLSSGADSDSPSGDGDGDGDGEEKGGQNAAHVHAWRRDPAVLREVVMPHCPAGPGFEELHTVEEEAALGRLILYHNSLCQTFAHATRRALAVLCARCYLLSWREWLSSSSTDPAAAAAATTMGEGS